MIILYIIGINCIEIIYVTSQKREREREEREIRWYLNSNQAKEEIAIWSWS